MPLSRKNRPARMTSREFNQHTNRAKAASASGPVIITDRGEPAHVLMSYADYERLTGEPKSLYDAVAMPETADIDLMQYVPIRQVDPDRFDHRELIDGSR